MCYFQLLFSYHNDHKKDNFVSYLTLFAELWLEFIQLEVEHPKGKAEASGQLHWRAMKSLDGPLIEKFTTQYTLMQTGHL